jgi:hypothetical protein
MSGSGADISVLVDWTSVMMIGTIGREHTGRM